MHLIDTKFVVIYTYTVKIIIRQGLFYYIDKSTNSMSFYICDIPDLTYEHELGRWLSRQEPQHEDLSSNLQPQQNCHVLGPLIQCYGE